MSKDVNSLTTCWVRSPILSGRVWTGTHVHCHARVVIFCAHECVPTDDGHDPDTRVADTHVDLVDAETLLSLEVYPPGMTRNKSN